MSRRLSLTYHPLQRTHSATRAKVCNQGSIRERWGWRSREDGCWLPLPTSVQASPLSFQPWRCPCGEPCLPGSGWPGPGLPADQRGWVGEGEPGYALSPLLPFCRVIADRRCLHQRSRLLLGGSVGTASPAQVLTALCYVPCTCRHLCR